MDTARLDRFIFDKMAASGLPGLSLALVSDGEVVYARGYGQRDLKRGLPATPDTLYCIGSVTKSFTALAVMQLAEAGRLELSDPVSDYLPFDLRPGGEEVRLSHLLSHATGLPALAYSEALLRHGNGTGGRYLPIAGPEDVLTFAAEAGDWAEGRPGERWFYFNEGYAMLGLVIERVSGQSYNRYLHEHILEPLGMTRSFFTRDEVEADDDMAVPYVVSDSEPPRPGRYLYRSIRSEGGLVSSVTELSRYLGLYLGGGAGVVSAASLEVMGSAHVPMPWHTHPALYGDDGAAEPAAQYGYGLSTEDFYGEPLVGHGGSVLVATAQLAFLPERGVGIAVLANGSGYPLSQIAKVALALYKDEPLETLAFLRTDTDLSALTGSYETYKGTMQATVRRQADFLELHLHDLAKPQRVILVPERLGTEEPSFYTLAGGRKLAVTFRRAGDGLELIYERYKLRRTGP